MEDQAPYSDTGNVYLGKNPKDNYTIIPNELIRNKNIPALPLRVLLWCLTHDRHRFRIKKMSVHKQIKEGRNSVLRAFQWLIEAGYIIEVQMYHGNLKSGINLVVYNEPIKDESISPEIDYHFTEKRDLEQFDRTPHIGTTEKGYYKKTNSKNISKPGLEKKPGSLPLDQLIVANEKRLRYLPKSVSKKPVTLSEANWVLVSMKMFNDVRAHRLGKLDDPTYRWLTPDLKACRQLVTLFRDDPKISDSWYATIENMFNEGYHQDNKWQYLTPEFVSRKSKYDIYYNAGA